VNVDVEPGLGEVVEAMGEQVVEDFLLAGSIVRLAEI
jgi:hypothetical protein